MSVLYSIVVFIIVLGPIVLVHEFGHFIAARLTGVRVEIFSFGFGKRLLGKKIGDTDFRLSLIPLGGYVKMAGEEEYDPNDLKPYEFHAKNRAQKIFILVMGPVMNLFLAFFIFTIMHITGVEEPIYKKEPPQIGYVEKGSPAAATGIQKGDMIRTIDGRSIYNWEILELTIGTSPNSELMVEFEQDGKLFKKKLDVKSISKYSLGDAGIYPDLRSRFTRVFKDSPAAKAGLKVDDILVAIDNTPVNHFEMIDVISRSANRPLLFKIKRGEEEWEIKVVPRKVHVLESQLFDSIEIANQKLKGLQEAFPKLDFNLFRKYSKYIIISRDLDSREEAEKHPVRTMSGLPCPLTLKEKGVIGIEREAYTPSITTYYGFFAAMKKSVDKIAELTFLVFNVVRKIIVGKLSFKTLSGPIEIAKFSRKALESGLPNFFLLIAFISLQLGLINLFPIPALDGGHLMVFSIEAVIRREFSQKVKGILMNIGFFILIALMLFVILNDLAKIGIISLPF
ncbi:MAG: RIP metalloprotease RseP [Candidatus Aminicenantes bacterium]|nr:RIP metalloprotease RseP [Candidatus Aminicenantes bacterium]NIM82513.1 RIP metalloprotease RseP [Candidatus Aminicenantes bacterium]NIN21871.1 RIP metalloprotease RseP [Candidatus Aminicenantes bacterium]NIN45649.1 RIP metalloprotease RseP [Candidatus Aminicenantes bacterium]NIN88482.1 RIP metalloprotease RseP [Candidatus Aminicenantes bacterium]